ncbi:MAG TPA: PQQ-dependent sugar dehydrogenase [Pseudolabrys sp.]|jgi:glucose/arabinose dehydrogenase|nr:PQQ-dependent sugar dehydrogenase [Pseudolabrys sp.]
MRLIVALGLVLAATGAVRAADPTFPSSAGNLVVHTVAQGLSHPWALAFLPDGRMLVTERPGRMRIVSRDGNLSWPLSGVPDVVARGQAGLLDVALDRDFATNRTIYFCFNFDSGGNAAVARAQLASDTALEDVKIIFRQQGPGGSNNHGCRIVQAPDKNLFVTLGDHFGPRDEAQNLAVDNGKIARIGPNGEIPKDNPFVGKANARPEIWSYGHRNPQGLILSPIDGKLWEQEHGPQGGDEINIVEKGKNYGWPVIGYGVDYGGAKIHESTHKAGMEQPLWHWTPSIAPSGMAFYTGDLFPGWKGSLFNGALKFQLLSRLEIKDGKVVKEERLLQGLNERIRDVRQGPDGALYLLTDNSAGRILRVAPVK